PAAAAAAATTAAAAEPVEQPLARAERRLRDAAHCADQRVRAAAPRVLVRLGRRLPLIAHRRRLVVLAARVVPGEDVLVLAVARPAVLLREADHRERVRRALQLQQLDQAVAD